MNEVLVRRFIPAATGVLLLAGCAGGPPSPSSLAYGREAVTSAAYAYTDTTSVNGSLMGQAMEVSQHGVAEYLAGFEAAPSGVGVVLSVRSLSGSLEQPLGPPVPLNEGMVDGNVEFTLDRSGNATVTMLPDVADEASLMVSGLGLAHTFFPALPGTSALPGEQWVDTLEFSGEEGPGARSQSSVLTYTVVGDTVVDGRSLLHVDMTGTTTMGIDVRIAGLDLNVASEMEVMGRVLWDLRAGILFEQYRESSGTGEVRVPIAPVPLPIRLRSVQRARLVQE